MVHSNPEQSKPLSLAASYLFAPCRERKIELELELEIEIEIDCQQWKTFLADSLLAVAGFQECKDQCTPSYTG